MNLVKGTESDVGTQWLRIDDEAKRATQVRNCTKHEEVSLQISLQIKQ